MGLRWRMETLQRHCECLSDTEGHQKAQERGRKSERPPCRDTHTQTSRDTMEMERQKGDFLMGKSLREERRECRDKDRRDSPAPPFRSQQPGRAGQGLGVPAGWASRAGRSLGKARRPYSDLLGCPPQLYNLLPQPGGRGRWTDRRMDRHTGARRVREGGEGRGGPSCDGEPPTRTHRHELVCGEGPARSVLRVGARTQESGPPAPSSPRNPGISP